MNCKCRKKLLIKGWCSLHNILSCNVINYFPYLTFITFILETNSGKILENIFNTYGYATKSIILFSQRFQKDDDDEEAAKIFNNFVFVIETKI